jgi:hypothetical protein
MGGACEFTFLCEQRWSKLEATNSDAVRLCSGCKKEVHLVTNKAQREEAWRNRWCIADARIEALRTGDDDDLFFVDSTI